MSPPRASAPRPPRQPESQLEEALARLIEARRAASRCPMCLRDHTMKPTGCLALASAVTLRSAPTRSRRTPKAAGSWQCSSTSQRSPTDFATSHGSVERRTFCRAYSIVAFDDGPPRRCAPREV